MAVPVTLETLARAGPDDARVTRPELRLPLPPRDHPRGRLRPADREPEPPACIAPWPKWHERTYSEDELAPHYALLAAHLGARDRRPDKAVTYPRARGPAGAAQRRVQRRR